jgi:flavin-dependent dehydrogenase
MSEVTIVGAGLAGLVAAINCARAGHRVRVLERSQVVGGDPYTRPAVDVTPMDTDILGRFIGIELGEPQIVPTGEFIAYIYGRRYVIPGERLHLKSVERGAGERSLDRYLYDLAVKEGAEIEFGISLDTQEDFASLPVGSIIATGLVAEPFRALKRPYLDMYGFMCKGSVDEKPRVVAFFDDSTKYYFYCANQNDIAFGLGFDRGPVTEAAKERWKRHLEEREGWRLDEWLPHGGLVATPGIKAPSLFAGNNILAGTLAGVMDPFLLFGVHSSLCSGKIAAVAVDDRERAWRLFEKVMASYKVSWTIKKIFDSLPHPARKVALRTLFGVYCPHQELMKPLAEFILKTVPGFGRLE